MLACSVLRAAASAPAATTRWAAGCSILANQAPRGAPQPQRLGCVRTRGQPGGGRTAAPRIAADLDRLDRLVRLRVDHGHVVEHAVGGEQQVLLGRQRQMPDPLADENVALDLERARIDDRDPIGAGPSATNAVAPSRVMRMPTGWMLSRATPGPRNRPSLPWRAWRCR